MHHLSDEQGAIVDAVGGHNVLVDAVAGSGKTTTILHIARRYPCDKMLVITYNKKLRDETKARVQQAGSSNVEVHNYHGFCVKYYDSGCHTDSPMRKIYQQDVAPRRAFVYDVIIIDEAQDMTPAYYAMIAKVHRDGGCRARMVVMGDQHQSIFGFNGADARFVRLADRLFDWNPLPWKRLSLSTTFRITKPMAQFMNRVVLGEERMVAVKEGSPVKYIVTDVFSSQPFTVLMDLLQTYDKADVFVIAPSVKSSQSPIRELANRMTLQGIPVFVPNSDEEQVNEAVMRGKLVFTTFHQVKGLERKVVLVFGCDASYFVYYDRHADVSRCPNAVYVALTRAQERLVVFHAHNVPCMPFMHAGALSGCCDVRGKVPRTAMPAMVSTPMRDVAVTSLISHVASDTLEQLLRLVTVREVCQPAAKLSVASFVHEGELTENVSDINGVAIPAYLQYSMQGTSTICEAINNADLVSDLLMAANRWNANCSGYTYKLNQISRYDWLSRDTLEEASARLRCHIGESARFEAAVSRQLDALKVNGYIDCIDGDTVWELKCVDALKDQHVLQLCVYAFLYLQSPEHWVGQVVECDEIRGKVLKCMKGGMLSLAHEAGGCITVQASDCVPKTAFRLFNVLDGHMLEVEATPDQLQSLMVQLVKAKYGKVDPEEDAGFVRRLSQLLEPVTNHEHYGMVLDVETDPRRRLVQVAYTFVDAELRPKTSKNLYVRHDEVLPDFFGRIDVQTLRTQGRKLDVVMQELALDLEKCKHIIGHNIAFDLGRIEEAFTSCKMIVRVPRRIDTMALGKALVNGRTKNDRLKAPRLDELHAFLGGGQSQISEADRHTADYDVLLTLECCRGLKTRGLL